MPPKRPSTTKTPRTPAVPVSGERNSIKEEFLQVLLQNPQGVNQNTLKEAFPNLEVPDVAGIINELLTERRIVLGEDPATKSPVFKAITENNYDLVKNLDTKQWEVYKTIEESGREGASTRTLRSKSQLPLPILKKILDNMITQKLIKSFKSYQGGNKLFYILFNVEPDSKHKPPFWADRHFVDVITQQCLNFISDKGFASLADVRSFINKFSTDPLKDEEVQMILDVLIYDDKIEAFKRPTKTTLGKKDENLYKATRFSLPMSALTLAPCGRCPVYDQCTPFGDISPKTCVYLDKWLGLTL
eukprot:TRINITY_DN11875_c0_g1_i1.p1 TRINITY_DN11875_c0_g1~~TRINITY_DN11875_c0_g1_i1.p1  ORF type:complete len:302 (-),score=48.61 TRINITY_DN11875_c0_g1_i1:97-1002(-)